MPETERTEVVEATVLEPCADIEVSVAPLEIEANFETVERQVDRFIEFYSGIVIDIDDDDQVKAAKKTCADFNKLADAIDRKRIDTGKAVTAYLEPFSEKCNALSKKVREARVSIAEQVDDAARKYRKRRRDMLEAHYRAYAGELAELVPYGAVHSDEWLKKKPMTDKKATGLLEGVVDRIIAERKSLAEQELEFGVDADRIYCRTLSVPAALAENARLKDEAFRRREHEEAARKLAEATRGAAPVPKTLHREPAPAPAPAPVRHAAASFDRIVETDEPVKAWTFRFRATRGQVERIAEFAKAVGVADGEIKADKGRA